MKRLLKSKKGMSLLEVLIALAILALLIIPIMTAFINTQIYARKVDKQTEINAITRTVKQIVSEGMIKNLGMIDKDNNPVKDASDNIVTFMSFINSAKTKPKDETTFLRIVEGNSSDTNAKFMYKIGYNHKDFYNEKYPNVYNLEITIYEKASSKVVNKIKIAVKV